MKRITTLFCALIAAVALGAQTKKFDDFLKRDITPVPAARASGDLADSSMFYTWNGTIWDAQAKKVYTYDAQGRISIVKEYNPTTGELDHQYTYSYHTNGEISSIVVTANVGGTMEPFERFRYNYDAQDNRTAYRKDTYFLQKWVEQEGDSVNYEYDANKRVLSYTLLQLNQGALYYYQKLIWSAFDSLDLPRTLTVQSYQGGFENYIQMRNITWKAGFDLFDFTPTSYFGYLWNNDDWNPTIYDTAIVVGGKISKSYLLYWNGSTMDTSSKTEYLYDQKGHKMQTLSSIYNLNQWSIDNGERDSIEYGIYGETKKRTKSYYSNSNQAFVYLNEERFFYNGLSVGEVSKNAVELYPNPANNVVNIQLESAIDAVRIIDMQGKTFSVALENSQLDISSLNPGLYIVQIESEGKLFTGRLEVKP